MRAQIAGIKTNSGREVPPEGWIDESQITGHETSEYGKRDWDRASLTDAQFREMTKTRLQETLMSLQENLASASDTEKPRIQQHIQDYQHAQFYLQSIHTYDALSSLDEMIDESEKRLETTVGEEPRKLVEQQIRAMRIMRNQYDRLATDFAQLISGADLREVRILSRSNGEITDDNLEEIAEIRDNPAQEMVRRHNDLLKTLEQKSRENAARKRVTKAIEPPTNPGLPSEPTPEATINPSFQTYNPGALSDVQDPPTFSPYFPPEVVADNVNNRNQDAEALSRVIHKLEERIKNPPQTDGRGRPFSQDKITELSEEAQAMLDFARRFAQTDDVSSILPNMREAVETAKAEFYEIAEQLLPPSKKSAKPTEPLSKRPIEDIVTDLRAELARQKEKIFGIDSRVVKAQAKWTVALRVYQLMEEEATTELS